MAFEVIPAIDVAGGRLVLTGEAGAVGSGAFGGDPVAAAAAYAGAGATRLHVVDVDLAGGGTANLALMRDIAALGPSVQASGGVTSRSQVGALLDAGADRVVLGSAALAYREATEDLLRELGERVVVGIEADGPTIRPRGRGTDLPLWETLVWLAGADVRRYLLTEVSRVGSLSGPDLDGIWALATHTERPVLAAGGITSVADLRAVAALGGTVEGAVVGRALQEGLDLGEAIAAVG
jgi:phosphoribosylformimino-5-aminoimidazole carboxamide ribonucleotide (ProFAR) isomerase